MVAAWSNVRLFSILELLIFHPIFESWCRNCYLLLHLNLHHLDLPFSYDVSALNTLRDFPSRDQVTRGCGWPLTLHSKYASLPSITSIDSGSKSSKEGATRFAVAKHRGVQTVHAWYNRCCASRCRITCFCVDGTLRATEAVDLGSLPSRFKPTTCYCCGAYLSSRHQIASDANYYTIRTLFIAVHILCLKKSAPARSFQRSQCSCGFLRILVH